MSRGRRELTDDERLLWSRVGAALDAGDAVLRSRTPDRPRRTRGIAPDSTPAPKQPPNRAGEKRVRRGKLEIGARLDLHGHKQATARTALSRFVQAASVRGDRIVVVVTGVGRAGGGVLRQRLPEWLIEPEIRALVSGYAQAHRNHGGAGAFYVFLKARRA